MPHILNCPFSNPKFLFSEDRVRNGSKKLQKSKLKATQGRLDMFFKPISSSISGQKRKVSMYALIGSSNVIFYCFLGITSEIVIQIKG